MKNLEKYAELVVRTGLNVQKGQTVIITGSIELPEFIRMCTKEAYKAGAREVAIRWVDEQSDRIFFDMADDAVFDEAEEWRFLRMNGYADKDACFLSILSDDPELMNGVDPQKLQRSNKAYAEPMKPYRSRLMSNKNAWCVISMPTKAWATKVFPEVSPDEAVDKLWDAILMATRADQEDPVAAWKAHQATLDSKLEVLNSTQFKAFRYKSGLGTDVSVTLPENHVWFGGADVHVPKGFKFVANMPTEEVFTAPRLDGTNGKIVASYPLVYNGVKIEGLWFEFKDGLVIDYGSDTHQDVLKGLMDIDQGAKRLGEMALVPYDSPISNQGILFYETLFDENASCHFAVGEAYPICVKGGEDMSEDQLIAAGLNVSDTHVDFMIGTADLEIIGIKEDGTEIQIFHEGNFSI